MFLEVGGGFGGGRLERVRGGRLGRVRGGGKVREEKVREEKV